METAEVAVGPVEVRGEVFDGDGNVGHRCSMTVGALGEGCGAEEAVFGAASGVPEGVAGGAGVGARGGGDGEDGDSVGEEVGEDQEEREAGGEHFRNGSLGCLENMPRCFPFLVE